MAPNFALSPSPLLLFSSSPLLRVSASPAPLDDPAAAPNPGTETGGSGSGRSFRFGRRAAAVGWWTARPRRLLAAGWKLGHLRVQELEELEDVLVAGEDQELAIGRREIAKHLRGRPARWVSKFTSTSSRIIGSTAPRRA